MIGIVIVAHDKLALGLLHTVEHVFGPQVGMTAVTVDSDSDRDTIVKMITAATNSVDTGDGVAVVTDVYGGSPCNLSLKATECDNCRVIYGANIPLLLKLTKSRDKPLNDAVRAAVDAGRKYMGSVSNQPSTV